MSDNELALFSDNILDILGDYDNTSLEPAEDVMAEADRLDRPGMLHKIAVLYIQGHSYKVIGEAIGVRPATISNVTNRQSFKSIIEEIGAEIIERSKTMLRVGSMEAVGVLLKTLRSQNEKNALAAANSVLNRVGLKSIDKIEFVNKVDKLAGLSEDELLEELIKEREARKKPKFVDVNFDDGEEELDVSSISREEDAPNKKESV